MTAQKSRESLEDVEKNENVKRSVAGEGLIKG